MGLTWTCRRRSGLASRRARPRVVGAADEDLCLLGLVFGLFLAEPARSLEMTEPSRRRRLPTFRRP